MPRSLLLFFILCFSLSCFSQSPACDKNYFLKTYLNKDSALSIFDMVLTVNNDVIVVGSLNNTTVDDLEDGFIFRIDKAGNKLWELTLAGTSAQNCNRIILLQDGNYLVTGYDLKAGSLVLLKIDINGNIIWRKNIKNPQNQFLPGVASVKENSDGSIFMAGHYGDLSTSGMLFTKFDNSGNFIYSNYITTGFVLNPPNTADMVLKDGFAYVVGDQFNRTATGSIASGFLCKIQISSGRLLWTKLYNYNNGAQHFKQIFNYSSTQLCILCEDDNNGSDLNSIMISDTSGTAQNLTYFRFGLFRQFGNATLDAAGNLLYGNFYYAGSVFDLALCLVNPYNGVKWAKHFPPLVSIPRVMKVLVTSENDIFCSGQNSPRREHLFISKHSALGDLSCPSEPIVTSFGTATTSSMNVNFIQSAKSFGSVTGINPLKTDSIKEGIPICKNISDCATLQIAGKDTLCTTSDTLIVSVVKNVSCISIPQLSYDTSFLTLVDYTNNIARFTVKKNGLTTVAAAIISVCDTLKASMRVFVDRFARKADLGPDVTLCSSGTVVLNAHSGFAKYVWQNGSADSTYEASGPGLYFVETTDICGNVSRDSILISTALNVPLELGADLQKCNNDTLTLTAPAGFTTYTWSPQYNINTTTGSAVKVFPAVNTMYKVVAEKAPGCFASDSVFVTVKKSPAISLGADTSLCSGDSIILDAGKGFTQFLWSNGSKLQQVKVIAAGTYSVIAATSDNCMSYDTLKMLDVWPAPAGFLLSDTTICTTETIIVSALATYKTYLWSNNSNTSSITVSKPGIYWLQVKDNHLCLGKDSILVSLKNCFTGFNVPSAFTPDKNGHNDIFKPIIGGMVKRYQFTIFNRWGQLVFTTTNINQGWDGTLNGRTQDANTFVWTCTYALEGNVTRFEKGTVLLVR